MLENTQQSCRWAESVKCNQLIGLYYTGLYIIIDVQNYVIWIDGKTCCNYVSNFLKIVRSAAEMRQQKQLKNSICPVWWICKIFVYRLTLIGIENTHYALFTLSDFVGDVIGPTCRPDKSFCRRHSRQRFLNVGDRHVSCHEKSWRHFKVGDIYGDKVGKC